MSYSVSYQMQCEVDYAKQQGPITSKTVLLLVAKTKYIHAFKRKKVKQNKKKTNSLKETQQIQESNLGLLVWKAGQLTTVSCKKPGTERAKNTKHFNLISN